jgi:signal transduction histidine kinase
MTSYQYTPYIWPILTGLGLSAAVGIYSWCHRNVPGATGLAFIMLFSVINLLTSVLELTAVNFPAKVFWFQVGDLCLFPTVISGLAFALGYAGLDTWLNRRTFTLIAIPFLLYIPLSFTNNTHHVLWTNLWLDEKIRYSPGALTYALPGYGLLISAVTISVLIGLFIRSPLHRWPIGLILLNMLASRSVYLLGAADVITVSPLDPLDLIASVIPLVYFVALFHFRLFDVVPVARNRAIEQMRDGMLVLDSENRVADLNRAAQDLIGLTKPKAIGRKEVQGRFGDPDLLGRFINPASPQGEIWLNDARCYQVHTTPLLGRHNFALGRLILLSDISERKKAQKQLQDHQLKLASLEEREWLARELHDGVGQALAAADLQVEITRELLVRGQMDGVRTSLTQLSKVIREGKIHVGDYLLGVKTWSSSDEFFVALRHYIASYSQHAGIQTELVLPPEIEKNPLGEAVETQIQRIIQEALTNIKKHANARSARVVFALHDSQVQIVIEDDGRGFDPADPANDKGFGLRAMRGRVETLGGGVELKSSPGSGTTVFVWAPRHKDEP